MEVANPGSGEPWEWWTLGVANRNRWMDVLVRWWVDEWLIVCEWMEGRTEEMTDGWFGLRIDR